MKRSLRLWQIVVSSVALTVALTVGLSTVAFAASNKASAELYELGESGVYGKAKITESAVGTTLVAVKLKGELSDEAMPAHVHPGTYEDSQFTFDPTPAYHLEDVNPANGRSVTLLDVPFEDFVAEDYLIAAHLPAAPGSGEEYGAAVVAGPVLVKGTD